jgi:pimeloyl-ACP methyl ester carboxylesterase
MAASTPRAVKYVLNGGFYNLAYQAWGDPSAPAVVCVHGLTRNARDFDALAAALSDRFHVLCPDLPGRGRSDWLPDGNLYTPPIYVQALSHLLAVIGRPVRWVGTSLGGICGMAIAACPGSPIERLVLNDIGPFIPAEALQRIKAYMSHDFTFPTLRSLELHLRTVHAPFGNLSDADWERMAQYSSRKLPDGQFAMHYDPAIAVPVRANEPTNVDMSAWWQAISMPVLAVRGADSDLLLPDTFDAMCGDGAEGLVVADAGHAPALLDTPTIERVAAFLA